MSRKEHFSEGRGRGQVVEMPVSKLLARAHPMDSGVVDEDRVASYAERMKTEGYDAGWAESNDDHVRMLGKRLLNGNHRVHAAARAGLKTLPVEVLS